MKVLHVVGTLDKSAGGPSRSVPQMCEFVSKYNVEIELVTRPSKNQVKINETNYYYLKNCSFLELFFFGIKISRKEISLIHLQHVWDPYIHIMAWFARRKNIPYIITPRGMLEPWIMNHNSWKKKLGLFLYQKKDLKKALCIHATCEMEKETVRNLGFKNPISVIPNGIDLRNINSLKTNFGTKKFVFLSRIHVKKGIELLLDAWKQLEREDWVVEIAGEGNKDYINKLIKKVEVEKIKGVSFVGPKYGTSKWDFIKNGDVFVLPTFSENFGIVVAEALASGVPVITTRGTPWEELNSHNCGWYIDMSIANLKHALNEAMDSSSEELELKGKNGRRLVEKKYDMQAIGKTTKEMYSWLMNPSSKTPYFIYKD